MANSTLIAIPDNIDDKVVLRRVLDRIVQELDEVKGHRGDSKAADASQLVSTATSLDELRKDFNKLDMQYIRSDGKGLIEKPISYSSKVAPEGDNLASVSVVDKHIADAIKSFQDGYLKEESGAAPADIPTGASLNATITKVNELLNILKQAKILS